MQNKIVVYIAVTLILLMAGCEKFDGLKNAVRKINDDDWRLVVAKDELTEKNSEPFVITKITIPNSRDSKNVEVHASIKCNEGFELQVLNGNLLTKRPFDGGTLVVSNIRTNSNGKVKSDALVQSDKYDNVYSYGGSNFIMSLFVGEQKLQPGFSMEIELDNGAKHIIKTNDVVSSYLNECDKQAKAAAEQEEIKRQELEKQKVEQQKAEQQNRELVEDSAWVKINQGASQYDLYIKNRENPHWVEILWDFHNPTSLSTKNLNFSSIKSGGAFQLTCLFGVINGIGSRVPISYRTRSMGRGDSIQIGSTEYSNNPFNWELDKKMILDKVCSTNK